MSNENKIRILYVQPGKYPEERLVANELHPLQRLVDGDIQAVYPWSKDNVALICNDSGKVDGLPLNRCIEDYDVIAGNFFICGFSGEEFCSLTDKQCTKSFLFLCHNDKSSIVCVVAAGGKCKQLFPILRIYFGVIQRGFFHLLDIGGKVRLVRQVGVLVIPKHPRILFLVNL